MQEQSTPPCPRCGGPRTFYVLKAPSVAGRRLYVCKPCKAEADAASHHRHRERRNARNSAYYQRTKERWSDYWKTRYANDPEAKREQSRAYAAEHPAEAAARARRWNERNPERIRVRQRANGAVARALKRGGIGLIEAAHYDYSRPLDVRWLCRSCHRRWDHADPKTH